MVPAGLNAGVAVRVDALSLDGMRVQVLVGACTVAVFVRVDDVLRAERLKEQDEAHADERGQCTPAHTPVKVRT